MDHSFLAVRGCVCVIWRANVRAPTSFLSCGSSCVDPCVNNAVRFLAFELLGMLFARSSELRRDIATVHLDNIIKLALGVKDGARCPLPEPLPFQKRLQENCIMQLQKWYEKYGEEFPKVCHPLFMWLSCSSLLIFLVFLPLLLFFRLCADCESACAPDNTYMFM